MDRSLPSLASRLARALAPLALALFVAAPTASVHAQAPLHPPAGEEHLAAEQPFAIGAYGAGWLGAYAAAGVGGHLRWEVLDELGIELLGEALVVESPSGFRHDHQVGFDVYVPLRLGAGLRLRPFVGFCTVFSLVEPAEQFAPRADDVLFGPHAGLGIEASLGHWFSLFLDAQAALWAGHDRSSSGWTGATSESYAFFGTAQLRAGAAVHFAL